MSVVYGFFYLIVISLHVRARLCVLRLRAVENALLHRLHLKGFSPVCERVRVLRLLAVENAFLHWLHSKGFSPV